MKESEMSCAALFAVRLMHQHNPTDLVQSHIRTFACWVVCIREPRLISPELTPPALFSLIDTDPSLVLTAVWVGPDIQTNHKPDTFNDKPSIS